MGQCKGECRGCGNKEEPKDEGIATAVAGASLADEAIEEMKPDPDAINGSVNAEVKAFIDKCAEKGQDPLQVVEHIIMREGFPNLEVCPKDARKAAIWGFLRGVLLYWISDMASFAAGSVSGTCSWKGLLVDYINDRFGRIFSRDGKIACPEDARESPRVAKPFAPRSMIAEILGYEVIPCGVLLRYA